jgi:hypothetical protein
METFLRLLRRRRARNEIGGDEGDSAWFLSGFAPVPRWRPFLLSPLLLAAEGGRRKRGEGKRMERKRN